MKSIIALVAVLALTTSASAATKTKSAKASKKGTRVAAVKKPAVSDVSSAASDVQLTETAKLSEVKPIVQAKKWSAGLDFDSWSIVQTRNAGTSDIETVNTAKVGYKVANSTSLTFAQDWYQTFGAGAEANTAEITMLDPSIRLSKSDLADLGNGVGLSGQARVYLPVSEASQDKGQITQIRLYATASREITKSLSSSFTLSPRGFIQQNDNYINAKGETKNVDTFGLLSSAGIKYALNDMVAVEQTLGVYQVWMTNTARADYLDAATSLYIAPVSWFELSLGLRQGYKATDIRKAGGSDLYNDDVTEYFLAGSFSI